MQRKKLIFGTIAVTFLAAQLLASQPETAFACSCPGMPYPPAEAFVQADAVFAGRVSSIDARGTGIFGGYPRRTVRFDVVRTWKDADASSVRILTGMGDGDCGFDFEEGKEYIVYANRSPDGEGLATGICSRTRSLDNASEDVLALGLGEPPALRSPLLHPTALAAFALGAALVLAGLLLSFRTARNRVRIFPARTRVLLALITIVAFAATIVLAAAAAKPDFRWRLYSLLSSEPIVLEVMPVHSVFGPPPEGLDGTFTDRSGIPYVDESHAAVVQPARISGRYLRILRVGAEEDPDARNTCDAFVVGGGDLPLIAHIREHIGGGNTASGSEEKGRLMIGIDLGSLSENARRMLEGTFVYPVELSVSLKEHQGKGAPPCYSPLILHDAKVDDSREYPVGEWKTYTHEGIGFHIKHPPYLAPRESMTQNAVAFDPLLPEDIRRQSSIGLVLAFTVRLIADTSVETLVAEARRYPLSLASVRSIVVGGRAATELRTIGAYGGETHARILIPHQGDVLEVSYVADAPDLDYPLMVETIGF